MVVSGPDGLQTHARTLWKLLAGAGIPTFLFINKMDRPGTDRTAVLDEIRRELAPQCVDMDGPEAAEEIALCDDALMERYLEGEDISDRDVAGLVSRRALFPCFFGSALKAEGADALLDALDRLTVEPPRGRDFSARVFRVSRAPDGSRLAWLKISGGVLKARDTVEGADADGPWSEKVHQIRAYSGEKFSLLERAVPGTACAVTGLTRARPGDGLGAEPDAAPPTLEPALAYSVLPESDSHIRALLRALRELEDEDPALRVEWNEKAGQIQLRLMGELQQSVVSRQLENRFGLRAAFGERRVLYKETIAAPVRGAGHFEPLRHYAEVHVLLEPLERGAGLEFAADCPDALLDAAQRKTVLACLREKTHLGVLTRSPVTDMRVTLTAGAYHEKHTEGGDFRQAASRAVRNALRKGRCVLLEPWYEFTLQVPPNLLGRAMSDVRRMGGSFEPPGAGEDLATLRGTVPVSEVGDYAAQVASYSGGRGSFRCVLKGYEPCHDAEAVVSRAAYDPDRDEEEPCGSVFCSHGAGFYVPWDRADDYMHVRGEAPRK